MSFQIDAKEDSSKSELPQLLFCTPLPGVKHEGPVTVVCLSSLPQERYIVCGSADSTLSVFDRQVNDRQVSLVGHGDQVESFISLICYLFIYLFIYL